MRTGIGVDGVASCLGAVGRRGNKVPLEMLIDALCYRFGADKNDAISAIDKAEKEGVVEIKENIVHICRRGR